ncbi:MAG: pyrroline-5-carboxylate reductase [Bacteroidota bacterium]
MENLNGKTLTLIGAGNLGRAIINGLLVADFLDNNKLIVTKRNIRSIEYLGDQGVQIESENITAVNPADIVIICVQPGQLPDLARELDGYLAGKLVISTVTGANLARLHELFGENTSIVRAMPNTAMAVQESMTCLSSRVNGELIEQTETIFSALGRTIKIEDDLMQAATVLGASGIAFWLRLIRATTQGGIELGFDAPEAQKIAVQTCLGAASLLASGIPHPEAEIDKVTTPKGCTIAGLNEMEHMGLSSAVIKGLVVSFDKINDLK